MTSSVFYRRRAERFAQLLDQANGGRRHHARSRSDEELADLVAVSDQLTALKPEVPIDPDFRSGLRAMLVAMAEREGIGATAVTSGEPEPAARLARPRPTGQRIRARGAVIVGVAVGAIAVSGMSAASENAMPGDALYGVKRSTERAQLALASSEVTRGQLFLDFARTRLAEAQAVRRDTAGFLAVLEDMDGDTRHGVKLLNTAAAQRREAAPLDAVDSFVTGQRRQLTAMLDRLSGDERERTLGSLALLEQVSDRAEGLREALRCSGSVSSGADMLGPKPARCWSAPMLGQPGQTRDGGTRQREDGQSTPTRTENSERPGLSGPGATTPSPDAGPDEVPTVKSAEPDPSPVSSAEDGLFNDVGRMLDDLLG